MTSGHVLLMLKDNVCSTFWANAYSRILVIYRTLLRWTFRPLQVVETVMVSSELDISVDLHVSQTRMQRRAFTRLTETRFLRQPIFYRENDCNMGK